MKVWFGQVYIELGVAFPFSHLFQRRLSSEVTALVEPSGKFLKEFGEDWDFMFNVSAKRGLQDNEIRGPSLFKKGKKVEYTIFLPFDVITRYPDAPRHFLRFLLQGVYDVFDELEIDKSKLVERQKAIVEGICADPTMLEEPSWDEAQNQQLGSRLFRTFYGRYQSG